MPWRKSAIAVLAFCVFSFVSITESKTKKSLPDYFAALIAEQHEDFKIDQKETKNSFLRASGAGEEYILLSVFRGQKSDLIVKSDVSCAPACGQSITTYRFLGEEKRESKFTDEIPQAAVDLHLKRLVDKMPSTASMDGYKIWYRLSKVNRVIDVLIYNSEVNPQIPTAYLAGRLTWSGQKFRFRGLWPKKANELIW